MIPLPAQLIVLSSQVPMEGTTLTILFSNLFHLALPQVSCPSTALYESTVSPPSSIFHCDWCPDSPRKIRENSSSSTPVLASIPTLSRHPQHPADVPVRSTSSPIQCPIPNPLFFRSLNSHFRILPLEYITTPDFCVVSNNKVTYTI